MLHHVSIGVANVGRAAQFYDAVLSKLGFKRVLEVMPYGIAYGLNAPQFWVQLPHDQSSPSGGNGTHIAFSANSRSAVNAFHAAAVSAGGKDEGGPGPRPEYSPEYYGAFARDPDGNKIEAVFFPMEATKPAATKSTKAKSRKAKPAKKAKAAKKAARKSAAKKAPKIGAEKRARKAGRRR